ncbi:MAG: EAL domain-containing protein [Betaproteobacteria bacterium]|nr:EAL domain-containing protein [Betaproteobacteria bacterium]
MKFGRPNSVTRILSVTWPLICVAVLQAALIFFSIDVLSTVRAYVNSESLYSKGQKDAVYFLGLYAQSGDATQYERYLTALAKPLEARRARMLLQEPALDHDEAYRSLLTKGNHPRDIPGMIRVARAFGGVSYFADAVRIWEETDPLMLELQHLGETIHSSRAHGFHDAEQVEAWLAQIHSINERFMPFKMAFSQALGEGSREVARILLGVNLVTVAILVLIGALGTRKLIRQRQRVEDALSDELARAQVTLAAIGDAVMTLNERGRIQYMNAAAERLIGKSYNTCVFKPLSALFQLIDADAAETAQGDENNPAKTILSGKIVSEISGSWMLQRVVDGKRVAVSVVATPLFRQKAVTGAVLVFRDMTRERRYMANLSWHARHDVLTGLYNRREFDHRLTQAIECQKDLGGRHALLYLDLDQFKVVNDTCGHALGDQLLCKVTSRLQGCLRESDTLARLGGDEFGVLLENCPPEPALQIAEKLLQAVADLNFTANGRTFVIGASIGLVNMQPSQYGPAEALQAADMACYLAKEKGRNRVQVYSQDNTELSLRFGEMMWAQQIHQALEEQRFLLYCQDIVAVDDAGDTGIHLEVLLRLQDESGRLVAPGKFIPAAERYGLMPLLDRWVVQNAFAIMAERQSVSGGKPITTCAINLSGATVGDPVFLSFLREQFALHKLAPETICFEVTETTAIANLSNAIHFIQELQAIGCKFALDDFGAGMASFAYLKQLPVDYLKIDGSFVKDMLSDPVDYAMVEMISHLAHMMGKRTIAEFVESAEILEALKKIGVDYAQGYAIAKPQPFLARPRILEMQEQGDVAQIT